MDALSNSKRTRRKWGERVLEAGNFPSVTLATIPAHVGVKINPGIRFLLAAHRRFELEVLETRGALLEIANIKQMRAFRRGVGADGAVLDRVSQRNQGLIFEGYRRAIHLTSRGAWVSFGALANLF